jgi:predicted transcriptional regulator
MKTITLKADEAFDATLARLASQLNATRSAVIREAVRRYEASLEREALAARIKEASLLTRKSVTGESADLDDATDDGL